MTELKPCPFCKAAARKPVHLKDGLLIECSSSACNAKPQVAGRDAIDIWNHRPLESVNAALLEAAKRVLAGLNERIDNAPKDAVPLFAGIAELHDAISLAEKSND